MERWLEAEHADSDGIWVRFPKKGTGLPTVDCVEAIEVALCFGWIDGQRKGLDETHYLQKFTPRRARSKWSQINVGRCGELIEAGRMRPAGQAEIDAAKADGRWDAAYAPASTIEVPPDLAGGDGRRRARRTSSPRSRARTATRSCSGSTTPSGRRRAPGGSPRPSSSSALSDERCRAS